MGRGTTGGNDRPHDLKDELALPAVGEPGRPFPEDTPTEGQPDAYYEDGPTWRPIRATPAWTTPGTAPVTGPVPHNSLPDGHDTRLGVFARIWGDYDRDDLRCC